MKPFSNGTLGIRKTIEAIIRFSKIGAPRAIALLLFIAFVGLRIWDPFLLQELRNRSFDQMQALDPRATGTFPVVIVDIDEESLKTEGQWPWPRTIVAQLINRLTSLGAAVIGFDIVFSEPDRYSPRNIIKLVPDVDQETRKLIRALPDNDQVFANAIQNSRVVLGESGVRKINSKPGYVPKTVSIATIGQDPRPYLIKFPALLTNLPRLDKAAIGRGLFTIRPERDGIVRRVPMVMQAGDNIVPSLTLEMLRIASGAGPIIIRTEEDGIHSVGVRGLAIPTNRYAQAWVHFTAHNQRRYVSAKDVLANSVPRQRIENKLVLIGTSAIGLLDRQTTPIDPSMPGVEVHAQILENSLGKNWIYHPPYAIAVELLLTGIVALSIIIFVPILGAATIAAIGGASALFFVLLSVFLYVHSGILLDATFPLLATLAVYVVLVFTNYFREEAQRERIRTAFRQYLSPDLVEQLAERPERLVLGGEEREMTIMFSDVRGFTTISESYKNDPQGLTRLMNSLLTPLTNAILDHRGTIDKYMGDAVMAFWNAPLYDQDHALNACWAAIEMNKRLVELNKTREIEAKQSGQNFSPIKIGIGINTGTCVVGNMGSDLRFDYSVLGDVVNLTSRIEGQTKTYGVPIIVGASTFEAAKKQFAALELDLIAVKGKTEPERIFGIVGPPDLVSEEGFTRVRDLMKQMLTHYRARRWRDALDLIDSCRPFETRYGLGTLLALYTDRISDYLVTPPPMSWDGVYVATQK